MARFVYKVDVVCSSCKLELLKVLQMMCFEGCVVADSLFRNFSFFLCGFLSLASGALYKVKQLILSLSKSWILKVTEISELFVKGFDISVGANHLMHSASLLNPVKLTHSPRMNYNAIRGDFVRQAFLLLALYPAFILWLEHSKRPHSSETLH